MAKKILIFGGGMTGLATGRELVRAGHEVHVHEASPEIGGLAKTYRDDQGFVYDNGPRFIFSTLAEKIGIAEHCEPVKYYEDLYVKGRYYLFPFGFIRNPKYCMSAGLATITRNFRPHPKNLGQFLRVYYGRIFSKEVLIPLIEKWSGTPAKKMSTDFASRLLPTNVAYIIHSLIKKLRGGVTEDYYKGGRYIVYPKGSNSMIFDALSQTPGLKIHLNSPLGKIATDGKKVDYAIVNGEKHFADHYISSIPIHHLANYMDNARQAEAWKNLHYRGIMILFIKINREKLLNHLWSWFPEKKYRFYRISEFKNALPSLAPKDKTLISVEIACETDDPFWQSSDKGTFEDIYPHLQELYGLKREDVIGLDLRKSPHAYPVLKKATEDTQRNLTHHTPYENLFIAGRTGNFQYRMLEGSFESAMTCAETVLRAIKGEDAAKDKAEFIGNAERDAYGRPLIVPE